MNPFIFRGHSYKYEEFRRDGTFIDCEYHDDKSTYHAHKIVLSIFSTLLRDYFSKFRTNNLPNAPMTQLPIPYNAPMFEDLVDFFYKNKLMIDKVDSSKLLPWLSMGYIYDVKTIREIIEPIITERFLSEPKDDDLERILGFSEFYKKIRLNTSIAKDFDHIEKNFQNFMESQQLFVEYLHDRFNYIENDKKNLSKLTPFLLSEILKNKSDYGDVRKARILENYVKNLLLSKDQLTVYDRKILQSVIDWNQDDAYKLFTYNDLDWVLPEVQTPQIKKLIRARRKTLETLEKEPCLQSSQPINHWYAISCVNKIETAHESTLSDNDNYSITHFIGTLGNSNKVTYINPKEYHFLEPHFSETMNESMHFDDVVVFDEGEINKKCHYLSKCIDLTNPHIPPPFVGFELPHTFMKIKKVVLTSACDKEMKRPKKMRLILDGNEIADSTISGEKITFVLPTPLKAKKVQLQTVFEGTSGKSAYFALRVHRLEVFGSFLSS